MKIFLSPIVPLVLAAGCAAASQAAPPVDADLAITRVTVIDVERGAAVQDLTVLIKANRIVGVGPTDRTRPAAGVRELDGRGRFLRLYGNQPLLLSSPHLDRDPFAPGRTGNRP